MDWGLLGLLTIMMLPMITGGIAFYYSVLYTEPSRIDHEDSPLDENSSDH